MKPENLLKKIEDQLRGAEHRLSWYLIREKKYRLTDDEDKTLERFGKIVKTDKDLRGFIHWNYYLGKWVAYQTIIGAITEEEIKNTADLRKKNKRKT